MGLRPRDNRRLLGALSRLRALGNTLLLVEHDREVIAAADHLLDFGPGAGDRGGATNAARPPEPAESKPATPTRHNLSPKKTHAGPTHHPSPPPGTLDSTTPPR